jgi:hypothetical protein
MRQTTDKTHERDKAPSRITENQKKKGLPIMFVSKEHEVGADLYIESDAEEIYVPANQQHEIEHDPSQPFIRPFGVGANCIIGYQKYIHHASRIA